VNWKPEKDEKPLTLTEFLAIAEKKYPGISRSPYLRRALNAPGASVEDALAALNPVRARANARLKGYARPLTEKQHVAAFKAHTGVRTYKKRTNTIKRRKIRRNIRADADNVGSLLAGIYQNPDRITIAVREMLQNSNDAIQKAKEAGQIKRGLFEVTFDRDNRTLTVYDNGIGMDEKGLCVFTTLGGTTKGSGADKRGSSEKYPPMNLSIRRYQMPKEEGMLPDGGKYIVRLNGMYQFEQGKKNSSHVLPFTYVFDFSTPIDPSTGKPVSAGGFGAAKAVIFASSVEKRWKIHTRDYYYDSEMDEADEKAGACQKNGRVNAKIVDKIQGTRLTLEDLDTAYFDSVPGSRETQGSNEPIEERIKDLLRGSTLPGIKIVFNGETIRPDYKEGTGTITNFGKPWEDKYFTYSFPGWIPGYIRGTSSNPYDDQDYPFGPGRDVFTGKSNKGFNVFRDSAEKAKDEKREKVQITVFDPTDPSSVKSEEAQEIDRKLQMGMDDPAIQLAIQEGQQAKREYQKALDKEKGTPNAFLREVVEAEREQKERERAIKDGRWVPRVKKTEDTAEREANEKATEALENIEEKVDAEADSDSQRAFYKSPLEIAVEALVDIFKTLSDADGGYLRAMKIMDQYDNKYQPEGIPKYPWVSYVRDNVEDTIRGRMSGFTVENLTEGLANNNEYALIWLFSVEEAYTMAATKVGGGGLVAVSAVNKAVRFILDTAEVSEYYTRQARTKMGVTNPFGESVAFIIDEGDFTRLGTAYVKNEDGSYRKENGKRVKEQAYVYDKARANRFVRNYGKYVSLLLLWDQVVRAIIGATKVEPQRGEKILTGFILRDGAYAVFFNNPATQTNMVLLNPLKAKRVEKGYKTATDFAIWLHSVACHEIAHMVRGVPHTNNNAHDEDFSIQREHIAAYSLSLIPFISKLVNDYNSKLRNTYARESVAKQKARYRKIAEDVTCPKCLKQAVVSLEDTGRLDTVRWIRERMGWEDADLTDDSDGMV
jgi:hypothetical protein